jgi:hypothetical protein
VEEVEVAVAFDKATSSLRRAAKARRLPLSATGYGERALSLSRWEEHWAANA